MKKRPKIIAACQDAGGCNAVYPVVRKLCSQGYSTRLYASLYAGDILRQKKADFSEITAGDFNRVGNVLDREGADLVLLGTSMGFSLEDVFVTESRKRDIPTVAVFDSWVNYSVRFYSDADKRDLYFLPDYVCVSDDFVKRKMKKEGIPTRKIAVTGNPYFDGLLKETQSYIPRAKKDLLAKWGCRPDSFIVSFFSQGVDRLFGDSASNPDFLGFTQFDALKLLITGLEKFCENKNVTLVIRPHPKEGEPIYRNFEKKKGNMRIVVDKDGEARKVLAVSDIVSGMFSIMLVEAYLVGKKILSVQPCLCREDPFILSRLKIVKKAGNLKEIYRQLNQCTKKIKYKRNKPDWIMPGESAARVTELIAKVLKKREKGGIKNQHE